MTLTSYFYTNVRPYLLAVYGNGFSRLGAVLKYVSPVCFKTFFYTFGTDRKRLRRVMVRCFKKVIVQMISQTRFITVYGNGITIIRD